MYKRIKIARIVRPAKSNKSKLTISLRISPLWATSCSCFELSSKICIDANKWVINAKQAKGTSSECQRINNQLYKLEEQVHQLFTDYLKINPDPTLKDFKSYLVFIIHKKGNGIAQKIYVSDLCDRYVKLNKSELGEKRIKRFEFNQVVSILGHVTSTNYIYIQINEGVKCFTETRISSVKPTPFTARLFK